jgi:hypothetical protein
MKKLLLIITTLLSFSVLAQQKPVASPPAVVKQKVGDVEVMIKYAQPSVKGRLVFGTKEQKALVPYGEVWRTGANEATTIEFSKDVTIQGKTLAKGVYSLLTIPGASDWTIIFNNDSKMWGAYTYAVAKDALRVTTKASTESAASEMLTISVSPSGQVKIAWDKTSASFYVK